MTARNVDCTYCGGKGTVIVEVGQLLEQLAENQMAQFDQRAFCTNCRRASRWLESGKWRGLAFHARQMAKPLPNQEPQGPQDLITIADAARLVDRHPNTISTRINLGDLPSYPNPNITSSSHPKKRQRLVSRAEVLALYPGNNKDDYFLRDKLTIEPEFRVIPGGVLNV